VLKSLNGTTEPQDLKCKPQKGRNKKPKSFPLKKIKLKINLRNRKVARIFAID
jgi:hypothetical protein